MKPILSVVIALSLCLCFFNAYSQGTSNKGTEFWTTYMDHIYTPTNTNPNNRSQMVLYITSDISTTGKVEIADGSFGQINFTVTANQVTFVDIPAVAYLGNVSDKQNKGIHITSAGPIAVYAHILANSVSGATLLFPVSAMGKSYTSLNYTQRSNATPSYSIFNIVATEDNTTVSITPSASLISGQAAGQIFNISLNKGEVYQGLSNADLTGTKIISVSNAAGDCKKIAVFSGSNKIGIGCSGNGSSDNLFQQVYPTSAWGKKYITAPLKSRSYEAYRVVLSDAATELTVNGAVIDPSKITSNYYEFTSSSPNVISADKPIQVVQYTGTQGHGFNSSGGCVTNTAGDEGDPEMIYLSPIEQGLKRVTLYSTGYYLINQSYINVVIPSTAVSSFTLDGVPFNSFTAIPNSIYSYAQIPVNSGPRNTGGGSITSGTHTISASEPFNAIAYGFGAMESYGYAAGTNLQDLNQYVRFKNPVNNNIQTSGCAGVSYNLEVTLPYVTTGITWKIDGNPGTTIADPPYTQQTVSGQTLYVYEYSTQVNFSPGSHKVIATVVDPNDECGATADIEHNFEITAPPTVNFSAPTNTCLGDATVFKDTSVPQTGATITSWLWDFGDGKPPLTEQNPTHTYSSPGDYTVTFTVIDNNGCSDTKSLTTHVAALPVGSFNVSTPNCEGQNITFTNSSTSTDGTINKWTWDYGDGSPNQTFTSGTPVNHLYAAAGSYNVILIVTTDKGCSGTITKTVVVNPAPVVDFTLPEVCLQDPFAQFTDKSTISGGTITSWLWDFGDATNSTLVNPNTSTLKNPRHKYINTGEYIATLTVTSASGCTYSKSQKFIVNSSLPKAKFSYPSNNLCSSDEVVFKDESNIDVGNIIKVVWYFDYNSTSPVAETYTSADMHADKIYRHNYGLFNTPLPKNYLVRMVVYSGESCMDIVEHTITVNPNPIVTLTPATGLTLCRSDAPVQILENKNGFAGTGVFTGTGISSTGLFDPKISGTGTFTINYLFTTSNTGCTYATTMQITVNTTPVINLASNLQLLEGGQLKIEPTAKISSGTLTYKWSPSAGLDRDDVLSPIANPTDDITYTLTVTSDRYCSAVARVAVTVLKAPVVNNTFTPNGDGINDTWVIKYLESYPKSTVKIFNRLGEQLFFSNGYPIAWDGRYRGADLPAGVYYYIIDPNTKGRKTYSGYVSIIR